MTQDTDSRLIGMREIARYCQTSDRTVRYWIEEYGFPAASLCGRWESDKELVLDWRRMAIENGGIPSEGEDEVGDVA